MLDLDALIAVGAKNEFKICDKCKGTNVASLKTELAKAFPDADINIACQSYCGPGRDYPFVFVNNKPIKAGSQPELIEKVKSALNDT